MSSAVRGALVAMALLVLCGAVAQQQRQGRGQFGQGMQYLSLLRMPDVQAELKLTEAQKQKIEAINVRPQAGGGPRTDEERQARAALVEKELQGILDKAQWERLQQLSLQARGPDALANDTKLQQALGLSEKQIKEISDTVAAVRQAHMQQFREMGQPRDSEQIMARMREMRKEMATKVEAILTAEQKTKYRAMQGKPFEFKTPLGFGPRGMMGGGRQPGGQGGRGGPGGPPDDGGL